MLHFELHVRSLDSRPMDKIDMIIAVIEELGIVDQCKLTFTADGLPIAFNANPFLRLYYSDDNMMHAIKALDQRNFDLEIQIVQMHVHSPRRRLTPISRD